MNNKTENNKQGVAITRKTEKLTVAVYLITDFFDSRESLKWELRAKALSFLSFVGPLFYENKNGGEVTKNNSEMLVQEILALLNLARNVFLVSPMNFSILKEEYQLLSAAMFREMMRQRNGNDFEFPEKFFAGSGEARSFMASEMKDKNEYRTESIKDINFKYGGITQNVPIEHGENIVGYKKDIRRETILKMLRAKGEITVKDISYLMSGVSEKTLQRELLAMVDEGILAKEGERRWSKYLLKERI